MVAIASIISAAGQAASIGGSIAAGSSARKAASEAAAQRMFGAERAGQELRGAQDEQRRFLDQTQQDYLPYTATGASAMRQLATILGIENDQTGGQIDAYDRDIQGLSDQKADVELRIRQIEDALNKGGWYVVGDKQFRVGTGNSNPVREQQARGEIIALRNKLQGIDQDLGRTTTRRDQSAAQSETLKAEQKAQADTAMQDFYDSPIYQNQTAEAEKAIKRAAASQGLLGSGATGKALVDYSLKQAGNYYDQYLSRVADLAGMGLDATNAQATTGININSNIAQLARGIAGLTSGEGEARAAVPIQRANTSTSMFSDIARGIGGMAGQAGDFETGSLPTIFGQGDVMNEPQTASVPRNYYDFSRLPTLASPSLGSSYFPN